MVTCLVFWICYLRLLKKMMLTKLYFLKEWMMLEIVDENVFKITPIGPCSVHSLWFMIILWFHDLPIIQKPVGWFALQINWLVSIFLYDGNIGRSRVNTWHIVPSGKKKWFFMFFGTSWNKYFWRLHRFFCSSKKSNCNIFIRSDFINIAFQWETNVNMENCYFWTFFFFK